MWSSEEDTTYPHRAGRTYENELQLHYLAPGAFTILPPEAQDAPPESPPPVLNNYRLTPTTRRHRNAAFSIIADPSSNPGSRSPSPTGRVSPFRGRGFNPIGSRHASPIPSPPPPEDRRAAKRSKIPTLSRRGSTAELTTTCRRVTNQKPPSPDSLIPRSRSQPPVNRTSENSSSNNSKNSSRDQSPSKLNTKDKYKNVKAKVNSFSTPKPKPKVPPKPQVPMPKLEIKNNKNKNATSSDNNSSSKPSNNNSDKSKKVKTSNSDENKIVVEEIENDAMYEDVKTKPVELKKSESSSKIIDASTVVSSTTTTATKPLNIEANLELDGKDGDQSLYLPDVRTLSATSVSSAINRMNDTVLDTKTLMKGVVPVVSTTNASNSDVLSVINEKNGVIASETVFGSQVNPNADRNSPTLGTLRDDRLGGGGATPLTNGRTKVLSSHDSVVGINVLPKSANDRIKDARTLVTTDVQPIQITVKEKPLNADVQSGNVRLSPSATNGISERPG
ncbi:hypothetical protein FQR65_LT12293 [Abscondita terminalis]|nr:hypothetical protein FQR65_LT12293 [Abscondita terminalis]